MLQLNNVVLIFLLFMGLAVSYAFAENPSPGNEWDFNIVREEFTVIQEKTRPNYQAVRV